MASVGVSEATALWVEDGVEAGYEHVGMLEGMRANNVSLPWASTSPGEEAKARETACNMPQVVDITSAAGTPLPVASPTTTPTLPSESRWKSYKSPPTSLAGW